MRGKRVQGTGARGGDPARAAREARVEAAAVLEDLRAEVASHLSMARAQLTAGAAPRGVALAHGGLVELVTWSRRVEAASLALASARIAWASLADAVEAQS